MVRRPLAIFILLLVFLAGGLVWIGRGLQPTEGVPAAPVAVDRPPRSEAPAIEDAARSVREASVPPTAPATDSAPARAPIEIGPEVAGAPESDRGSAVSGRVEWPDGRPAKGCDVEFEVRVPRRAAHGWMLVGSSENRAKCGDDGTFSLPVFGEEPVALIARATFPPGYARVADVAPGTSGLVIVLRPAFAVRGRALDDRGAPLARFKVVAAAANETSDVVECPSEDGTFVIGGLQDGPWEIRAEAQGHSRSAARRVLLPDDVDPVDLVLPRCAAVAGKVLLPNEASGPGAGRARVESLRPTDLAPRTSEEPWTSTDEDGAFVLEGLDAGPQRILASKPGYADGEPLDLELRPGEIRGDLVLRLRLGGRIDGLVLDPAGAPLGGVIVNATRRETGSKHDVEADPEGRFVFEALAAGRYRLLAVVSEDENPLGFFGRSAMVDVVDGETSHVTIGGPVQGGIRVHGRITAGARAPRPRPGCTLQLYREDSGSEIPRIGRSDDQGRYEIFVDEPGPYLLLVHQPKPGNAFGDAVQFLDRFRVPSAAEFEHDVVLPSAFVGGRVLLSDGSPARDVSVILEPEASTADLSASASAGFRATDEAGAFAFDGLKAGTYRISAGTGETAGRPRSPGRAVRRDLVLAEDDRIEDVELRLVPAARLEGLVTGPDGKPCAGARLLLREESGSLVQVSHPAPSTDASGRFTIEELTPGAVTVGARTARLAAVENPRVLLLPGETARVSLALGPGTVIRVIVQEKDGRPVGAALRVVDARGLQVGAVYPFGLDETGDAVSPEEGVRIGPIPPGRYTVTATNHDRTSTSREVTISGDEQVVTLKFGG